MNKRFLISIFAVVIFASAHPAETQQPKKVPRIGYLTTGSPSSASVRAFQQGLRDLGYIESQNITIEYRSSEGMAERLPNLVAELVQLKVDILIVSGSLTTQAAKNATQTIPIVMTTVTDPVVTGLIASLAHPGGNVTGLSNLGSDLGGKQMELLQGSIPESLPCGGSLGFS